MNKLKFINHSSFNITNGKVSLSVDPWIEGLVFNNSWSLLSKTPEKCIQTVKNSDYIWFSHEHPDHFNPPDVKLFGKNKKFLFQRTKDKRVVNFLKKFSSDVKELNISDDFNLDNNFSIKVMPFQDLDSFCIIKIGSKVILNLNDCHIKNHNELNEIKLITGDVDILMTQFSYAIGKSNKDQQDKRKKISNEILVNLNKTISFFKPKHFIPFASFCYFSRHDNFYLNDSINKIDNTINFLKKNNPDVNFICLYPGDEWNLENNVNNDSAINKYLNDYKNISPIEIENKKIKITDLQLVANKFINNTILNNNLFKFYEFIDPNSYKIYFKLTDINSFFSFNFKDGLTKINNVNNDLQICELTSDSLYQLFSSGYGYDALMIGGRFEANFAGNKSLNKIFKFQTKNYQNQYYNLKDIIPKLIKKILKSSRVNLSR